MPTTRHVSTSRPRTNQSTDAVHFAPNHHLLITTPSHIYAWNASGLRTVFTSGKAGIVAARARNGVLAVADSQVVILHDTKHGQDTSWGLTARGDEVRLLENTKDGLYLTTKLTNEILRYSTLRSRVQSPIQAHSTAPVALACSTTYVVSASDNPPVVYLKNLSQNTSPILLKPRGSNSTVCLAAFHPQKDNIFLLAFKDGTIAAYNANEVSRSGHDGEIGHLREAHRGVSSCAFIRGAKARAVSVGSDARCRLIDLENGVIVRTWHAKAPLTSVCTLDGLIAVARVDGKVHLYDTVGVLQAQQSVSKERIISVEWVSGVAPPAIPARPGQDMSDAPSLTMHGALPDTHREGINTGGSRPAAVVPATKKSSRKSEQNVARGEPPALGPTSTPQTVRGDINFTVHSDDTIEGTVRHTVNPRLASSAPKPNDLLDLFSPVKPAAEPKALGTLEKRPTTSPRQRPRISTQTFMKSPVLGPADSHATSSGSDTARQQTSIKPGRPRKVITQVSPLKRRRVSFKPIRQPRCRVEGSASTVGDAQDDYGNENARVLAGLRQMAATGRDQGSVLGAFAAKKAGASTKAKTPVGQPVPKQAPVLPMPVFERHGLGVQKAWDPGNVLEREDTWPTDSVQDEQEDDIWLTADESEGEAKRLPRRRQAPLARPPARQTSRSRVDSNGTYSTVQQVQNSAPLLQPRQAMVDGSTGDSAFDTAYTHLSPSGAFSPASAAVRELFPRTSSLSPARKRPKSPWERAKANKARASLDKSKIARASFDKPLPSRPSPSPTKQKPAVPVKSPKRKCADCVQSDSRISRLEEEVARLRGEVLGMKALLRRNGLPAGAGAGRAPAARSRML